MATAQEMGATVVRSQTMGDSVGCAACIEPELGQFNEEAFAHDRLRARVSACARHQDHPDDRRRRRDRGRNRLRLSPVAGHLATRLLADRHGAVLDRPDGDRRRRGAHRRAAEPRQRVHALAYKDDPTILGWDLLNGGGSPSRGRARSWTTSAASTRGISILSGYANAGFPESTRASASSTRTGSCRSPSSSLDRACKRAGKPFIAYEYGWDRTNYPTLAALGVPRRHFAARRRSPATPSGRSQSHNDGHGWMPIPADTSDPTTRDALESGQWWALYYPGIQTLVSTAADMSARAQAIRRHDYAMRGMRVPAHAIPPRRRVVHGPTSSSAGRAHVYWQGSAGAVNYSVERAPRRNGPWMTVCRRCVTDVDDGYADVGGSGRRLVSRDPVQPRRKARACIEGDAVLIRLTAVTRPRRRARSPRRRAVRHAAKDAMTMRPEARPLGAEDSERHEEREVGEQEARLAHERHDGSRRAQEENDCRRRVQRRGAAHLRPADPREDAGGDEQHELHDVPDRELLRLPEPGR